MNIYKRIFFLTSFIVVFTGCNKEIVTGNTTEEEIDIKRRYIYFDAGIATRGELIEGKVLQDDFYVLGYKDRNDWNGIKVKAKPNVFDSTPEKVVYTNGIYDYETLQPWDGNIYSFFGYYPTGSNYIKLFENGSTIKEGEPYITYTLPGSSTNVTQNDPRQLIDIMTAASKDKSVRDGLSVVLEYQHRLAAIDLVSRNYYEYDHDSNVATDAVPVTIEISNLKVKYNNIHTQTQIFLDEASGSKFLETGSREYQLIGGGHEWSLDKKEITPNTDNSLQFITTKSGDNATVMLFDPQKESLQGSLMLTYTKKYMDNNGNWRTIETVTSEEPIEFDFGQSLIKGSRYAIEILFTSDAVTINIYASDQWDVTDDVKHDFE